MVARTNMLKSHMGRLALILFVLGLVNLALAGVLWLGADHDALVVQIEPADLELDASGAECNLSILVHNRSNRSITVVGLTPC